MAGYTNFSHHGSLQPPTLHKLTGRVAIISKNLSLKSNLHFKVRYGIRPELPRDGTKAITDPESCHRNLPR